MSKNFALGTFVVLLAVLFALVWFHTGTLAPPSGSDAIWFHAGLLLLLVGRYVTEYRFTRPNDVFVNCIAVFVSVSTLDHPPLEAWWEILRWVALACALTAVYLAWDPGREARLFESRFRSVLYQVVTSLGRAEVMFSLVFILALLSYFEIDSEKTRVFVISWGVMLLAAHLEPERVALLLVRGRGVNGQVLGIVHSFLSPSIVFYRRLGAVRALEHQLVGFVQKPGAACHAIGMVIGERSSAGEQRVAVALIDTSVGDSEINDRSYVVSLSDEDRSALSPPITPEKLEQLSHVIGTVSRDSTISQLRIELFGQPALRPALFSALTEDRALRSTKFSKAGSQKNKR